MIFLNKYYNISILYTSMNGFILNLLQVYPYTTYQFGILYSLINMNLLGILYTASGGISEVLNFLLKQYVFTKQLGNWTSRPKSPSRGCGIFGCPSPVTIIEKGNDDDRYVAGMPSGHAQTSFMFATFWALYLFEKYSVSESTMYQIFMYLNMSLLFIFAFVISWQRLYVNCHKPLQIFVGSIIGVALGYGMYRLSKWIMSLADKDAYDEIYKYDIPFFPYIAIGFIPVILFTGITIMIIYILLVKGGFIQNSVDYPASAFTFK